MAARRSCYANDRLPFEILGLIFQLHSQSVSYELETLLLVCNTWSKAALSHKSLWSTFALQIDHEERLKYWENSVPRRILRCATNSLLDIDITVDGSCDVDELIEAFAGASGENVQRWRTFRLDRDAMYEGKRIIRWLSMPTPNLKDFNFHGRGLGPQNILPYAPLLQRFSVTYFGGKYPDLCNATTVLIAGSGTIDNEAISKAKHVVELGIEDDRKQWRLPCEFPLLQNLFLSGDIAEGLLDGFSAPQLQMLDLRLIDGPAFNHVTSSRSLKFQSLTELRLGLWPWGQMPEFVELISGVRTTIEAALSIRTLRALDDGMAMIILNLLEDVKYASNHQFVFQYKEATVELKQGDQRRIALAEFCQATQIQANESWETICDLLGQCRLETATIIMRRSPPLWWRSV